MRHVLNFQAQFADLVASGEKRQTIRAPRKRPISVGDELRLYTGMRTKACRLLGVVTCEKVTPVRIERLGSGASPILTIDGVCVAIAHNCPWDTERRFARADGFKNWREMCEWFDRTHGLPFEGVVIRWGELR